MAWKNVQYDNGKYRTSEGGGGGSSTFADLDDVSFSNLQNGQVAKYNSTTQKWENADESGGGGTITDVEVDGVSVVDSQTGVAKITMPTPPTIPVNDVEVNGTSVVNAQKIAEIKSYKEVTQAEYDALPSSKNSNGIAYFIKDAGDSGGVMHHYSSEEKVIGTYFSKPLYEKSFQFSSYISLPTKSWTTVMNVSSLSISKLIRCDFIDQEGICWSGALNRISNGNLQSYIFEGWPVKELTLQYTKTTD